MARGLKAVFEAECGCQPVISPLDDLGVQIVHDETTAELFPHPGSSTDMVDVAMGRMAVDIRGERSPSFDVGDHPVEGRAEPGVYEYCFPVQIEQVDVAVPSIRYVGAGDAKDPLYDYLAILKGVYTHVL